MPYICKDCPNKERFTQTISGTCNYSCTDTIDESGDCINSDNYDYYDYDQHGYDDSQCIECGSFRVVDVEQDDWEAWEGPEQERDPDEKDDDETWEEYMKRRNKAQQKNI